MSSMEPDGVLHEHKSSLTSSSIETDTPGSSFGSLKRSQLKELRNAQEISTQTPPQSMVENVANPTQAFQIEAQMSTENLNERIKTTSFVKNIQNENNSDKPSVSNIQKQQQVAESMSKSDTSNAESKLWSRPPHIARNVTDILSCLSLEDCAVPSPLESKKQQQTEDLNNKTQQPAVSTSNPESLEKTPVKNNGTKAASSPAANNSLASSFIMGEINADVLKVRCSCLRRFLI